MIREANNSFHDILKHTPKYDLGEYEYLYGSDEAKIIRHKDNGQTRVLKHISNDNIDVYKRILKEHLSDAPKIDLIVDDDKNQDFYIVEEYIEGDSLNNIVSKDGAFSESLALKFALQLVDILIKLNNMKPAFVHGDLSLENIIITKDEKIKLINFKTIECKGNSNKEILQYKNQDIPSVGEVLNKLLTEKSTNEVVFSGKMGKVIKKAVKGRGYKSLKALERDLKKLIYVIGDSKESFLLKEREKYTAFNEEEEKNKVDNNKYYVMRKESGINEWSTKRKIINVVFLIFLTYCGIIVEITYSTGDSLPILMSILSKIVSLVFYYLFIVFFNNMWGVRGVFTLNGKFKFLGTVVFIVANIVIASIFYEIILRV